MHVLVINSGSSSLKFALYDMPQENMLVSGKVECIGEPESSSVYRRHSPAGITKDYTVDSVVADHTAALNQVLTFLKSNADVGFQDSLYAIGHRVVHGGETFKSPTLINEEVIRRIRSMVPLAPLHNPANLAGIETIQHQYPQVPQVAVFDTAFFQALPPHAYRYALPDQLYTKHHVRRYGFHGISHQHVARQAADYLQRPLDDLRLITLHLGNGASAAAIRDGICIDTSMGMTPLEGLIMGTRCGDLDPSIHFYLARTLNMEFDEIEKLLNHDSGMQGLCGVKDMREVHRLADEGNKNAILAIEMYCYRICKYIGAYYIALGGLDALIFTGGIGENDAVIRRSVCGKLSAIMVAINQKRNLDTSKQVFDISTDNSAIRILVIPANEELEIARQTMSTIHSDHIT